LAFRHKLIDKILISCIYGDIDIESLKEYISMIESYESSIEESFNRIHIIRPDKIDIEEDDLKKISELRKRFVPVSSEKVKSAYIVNNLLEAGIIHTFRGLIGNERVNIGIFNEISSAVKWLDADQDNIDIAIGEMVANI